MSKRDLTALYIHTLHIVNLTIIEDIKCLIFHLILSALKYEIEDVGGVRMGDGRIIFIMTTTPVEMDESKFSQEKPEFKSCPIFHPFSIGTSP
jgi:hypothetical protein